MTTFTNDELLQLLAEAEKPADREPGLYTRRDVEEAARCGRSKASRLILDWLDAGLIEYAGKVKIAHIFGDGYSLAPAFRVKGKELKGS